MKFVLAAGGGNIRLKETLNYNYVVSVYRSVIVRCALEQCS